MNPFIDYFTLIGAATRTVLTSRWPQNWRRFKFLFLFALVWPLMKAISIPCLMLDYVFYPKFRRVQVKEPLFIVGNWRTGSTLLYRTFARDDESVACFTMLDAFLPAITMKRAAAWLGRIDKALGSLGNRFLMRMDHAFLSEYSRIHDTGFFKPEEDEHALLLDLCSAAMFELFPMVKRFRRLFWVDQEMPRIQQEWVMKRYRKLVMRQLYHLGPHKRFVSKNPLFTHKIESLARHFPDAKFVNLVRNPVNTICSTASLFHFVWHQTGALPPGEQDMDMVLEMCHSGYRHAHRALEQLDEERSLVVLFDDLVGDPGGTIRLLYVRFDWRVPASMDAVLSEAGPRQRRYKTSHSYTTAQWGLSEQQIYQDFQYVYREHDFPPPAAVA